MHYVYILYSEKDKGLYIGSSGNLKVRKRQHDNGEVTSTKFRRPLTLVHYEAYLLKEDALAREEYLKSGGGRKRLAQQLKRLFNKLNYK